MQTTSATSATTNSNLEMFTWFPPCQYESRYGK